MESITLKIDLETLNKMETFYQEIINREPKGDYILWSCKTIDEVNITIFTSKKGLKAFFTGENCLNEARIWNSEATYNQKKEKIEYNWLYLDNQIGSDEVGTGDFFGPIIVVASYIKKEDIPFLRELKVNDSKKLTDDKILEIVPKLLDKIVFSKLTCSNTKYNQLVNQGYSMNKIKAILHNHAINKVKEKINNQNVECFIDQFCDVDLYYNYLQYEEQVTTKNITFHTKGESYYPSIAVSSMIARYCFLKEIDLISDKYQIEIIKGASKKTDQCAEEFYQKYGLEELKKVVKINFKNYQELIENSK